MSTTTDISRSKNTTHPDISQTDPVITYILSNLPRVIRAANETRPGIIPLPNPYTSPCPGNLFAEQFYWDTFFINEGLLRLGNTDLALNNANNLLYLVDTLGYVPNSNHRDLANRSQAPYLAMIVRALFDATGDFEWLRRAYPLVVKEYHFWMTKRMTPIGLNRYFHHATPEELRPFYDSIAPRIPLGGTTDQERLVVAAHYMAEAESGWDFNPRFDCRCADHAAVDLNANLYLYEQILAQFSRLLGTGESDTWEHASQKRRELMVKYCWDPQHLFFADFDFVNNRRSPVRSLAAFQTLFAGLATEAQAVDLLELLPVLERPFGLATCEQSGNKPSPYQWNYPNGWAPLQYVAIRGLSDYGYKDEARRIARKYMDVVTRNLERTGDLWEKYNIVDGTTSVQDEYPMPPMLGWTGSVYLYAKEVVGER